MPKVVVARGHDVFSMVERALRHFGRPGTEKVVIKPNLIIDRPGPTTPVDLVEALVRYYRPHHEVVVAEGSGWCETWEAFEALGYTRLAEQYGIKLVDLNKDRYEVASRPDALVLRSFELPLTVKDAFLISAALLKTHSLTGVSLSMKNMLGIAVGEPVPAGKKRRFHKLGLHESIVDICFYKRPDLAVIDGRVACIGGELGGRPQPFGLVIFSDDPVAADAFGARLLGHDPFSIRHIRLAHELGLGTADLGEVEIIELMA